MVAIVLINFNGYVDTVECLNSIWRSSYDDIEVIVVDNGSDPDTIIALREACNHDRLQLIELQNNLGFSGANNIGIEHALKDGANYVLLLNNDTVIDSEMISALVEACDDNEIAIPYMYYYSDPTRVWYAGGQFDFFGIPRHNTTPIGDFGQTDFATGCCMLLPRTLLFNVGKWDEEYFLYWEDSDFSIRLKQAGYKMRLVPEAALLHKVSASTGGEQSEVSLYYLYRNKLLFMHKIHAPLYCKAYSWLTIITKAIASNDNQGIARKALVDYLDGKTGKCDYLDEDISLSTCIAQLSHYVRRKFSGIGNTRQEIT